MALNFPNFPSNGDSHVLQGITFTYSAANDRWSSIGGTVNLAFSGITGLPTTLLGYGITDALPSTTEVDDVSDANLEAALPNAVLTSFPAGLARDSELPVAGTGATNFLAGNTVVDDVSLANLRTTLDNTVEADFPSTLARDSEIPTVGTGAGNFLAGNTTVDNVSLANLRTTLDSTVEADFPSTLARDSEIPVAGAGANNFLPGNTSVNNVSVVNLRTALDSTVEADFPSTLARDSEIPTVGTGANNFLAGNTFIPTLASINLKANLASPALTGTPTAPTQSAGNSSTRLATTAFVRDNDDPAKANLSSPTFTGTPQTPTVGQATNNTTIASTAYVREAVANVGGGTLDFNGIYSSVQFSLSNNFVFQVPAGETSATYVAEIEFGWRFQEAPTGTFGQNMHTGWIDYHGATQSVFLEQGTGWRSAGGNVSLSGFGGNASATIWLRVTGSVGIAAASTGAGNLNIRTYRMTS